ncbi:MAG TPA: hypothetical protein DEG44_04855, partial [Candidatus Kerfeldbacteria bacterium]|nr:hypothetical protein [Candidatus Kerfeldbacteria bacterium]
ASLADGDGRHHETVDPGHGDDESEHERRDRDAEQEQEDRRQGGPREQVVELLLRTEKPTEEYTTLKIMSRADERNWGEHVDNNTLDPLP